MHIFLWYLLIINIITFVVYAVDKLQAKANVYRTPEKVLLTLSLIGGAFGALIAMYQIRHKNQKKLFIITNWSAAVIYLVMTGYLLATFPF